jgi:Tfp pilus assembly protein PilV
MIAFSKHPKIFRKKSGFMLFEVMVAVTVFAVAALGLANALNNTIDAALAWQREGEIRLGLQSKLAELKAKPLQVAKVTDPADAMGVVYESEVQQMQVRNEKDLLLSGIYRLTVRARWRANEQEQEAIAEIYVLQ